MRPVDRIRGTVWSDRRFLFLFLHNESGSSLISRPVALSLKCSNPISAGHSRIPGGRLVVKIVL